MIYIDRYRYRYMHTCPYLCTHPPTHLPIFLSSTYLLRAPPGGARGGAGPLPEVRFDLREYVLESCASPPAVRVLCGRSESRQCSQWDEKRARTCGVCVRARVGARA